MGKHRRLAPAEVSNRKSDRVPAGQGWDVAEFSCGRCGWQTTVTTEAQYVRAESGHRSHCTGTWAPRA